MKPNENDVMNGCDEDNCISVSTYALAHCSNKRVVHFAKFGRTQRIRNKNLHRAIKILTIERILYGNV